MGYFKSTVKVLNTLYTFGQHYTMTKPTSIQGQLSDFRYSHIFFMAVILIWKCPWIHNNIYQGQFLFCMLEPFQWAKRHQSSTWTLFDMNWTEPWSVSLETPALTQVFLVKTSAGVICTLLFMLSVHHWDTQNNKCHRKMQNSRWLK